MKTRKKGNVVKDSSFDYTQLPLVELKEDWIVGLQKSQRSFFECKEKAVKLFKNAKTKEQKQVLVRLVVSWAYTLCRDIEDFYESPMYRPFVEGYAATLPFFPALFTNLPWEGAVEKGDKGEWPCEKMRRELKLKPPPYKTKKDSKEKRGSQGTNDELTEEVIQFIRAVHEPHSVVMKTRSYIPSMKMWTPPAPGETPAVGDAIRSQLLSVENRHNANQWAKTFVLWLKTYFPYKLAPNAPLRKYAESALSTLQKSNSDEKSWERALIARATTRFKTRL